MSQAVRRSAGPVAIGHHVGGKPRPGESGRASDVFNPATGELTGRVALASEGEVAAAVAAAKAASAPGRRPRR